MPVRVEVRETRESAIDLAAMMRAAGRDWPSVARALVMELVEVMELTAKTAIKSKGMTFRNTLMGSVINQVLSEGAGANHQTRGFVLADTPYAETVDKGRRAGAAPPPSEALIPWVRERLATSAQRKETSLAGVARKRSTDSGRARARSAEAEIRALAFVVARSIGRRGMIKRFGYDGAHYFQMAMDEGRRRADPFASRILQEFIDRRMR